VPRKRKAKKQRKPRARKPAVFLRAGRYELWQLSWPANVNAPLQFPALETPYRIKSVCITFDLSASAGWVYNVRLTVFNGAGDIVQRFGSGDTSASGGGRLVVTLSDVDRTTTQNLILLDEWQNGCLPPDLPILTTMRWELVLDNDPAFASVEVEGVSVMIEQFPVDVPTIPVAP